MQPSQVTEREPRVLISSAELLHKVGDLAKQLSSDYQGKDPILVGVLKGAFMFMADLVRHLDIPVRCDFVKVSSYGVGKTSSGQVKLQLDVSLPVEGQHLVIVEDIIDTGTTTAWLLDHLRQRQPASVRICALLDKPARRQTPVPIDYRAFSIPDRFVVGYGIDCGERYRQLPYVGYILDGEASDDGCGPTP
jgi:hypoxanthine phosphoribosyltransferase